MCPKVNFFYVVVRMRTFFQPPFNYFVIQFVCVDGFKVFQIFVHRTLNKYYYLFNWIHQWTRQYLLTLDLNKICYENFYNYSKFEGPHVVATLTHHLPPICITQKICFHWNYKILIYYIRPKLSWFKIDKSDEWHNMDITKLKKNQCRHHRIYVAIIDLMTAKVSTILPNTTIKKLFYLIIQKGHLNVLKTVKLN